MRVTEFVSLAALAIIAFALAIACDERNDGSDASRPPCVIDAMATAAAAPARSSGYEDHLPGDDEGHCLLRKALLNPDVLPGGLGEFARASTGGLVPCGLMLPSSGYGVGLIAMSEDQASHLSFRQQAVAFPDGQAELVLDAIRHSCDLMMQIPQGEATKRRYQPLSIGEWGDESFAILERLESGDGDALEHVQVVVRKSNVLSSMSMVGMEEQAMIRRLVSRASDQLDAVGPVPEPTHQEGQCDLTERWRGSGAKILGEALLDVEDFAEPGWVELAQRRCPFPKDAHCQQPNASSLLRAPSRAVTAFVGADFRLVDTEVYGFDSQMADRAIAAYRERDRAAGSCTANASDGDHRWSFGPLRAPQRC